MKSFYDKDEYSINDLQSLIDNEVEESVYLDYKSAEALGKSDGKKKEISKDIASFANSDGGIVVYGINELNHKANSFSFIDGDIFTKEWLEHVINSSIQRRINELEIIPVRENNSLDKTIYIVKIPKSIDAPHQSRDKRFYKRFNFESVPMEEHEIRQLYGRKLRSKLMIDGWAFRQIDQEDEEKYRLIFEVAIYNDGDISEDNYKLNVIFENFKSDLQISWDLPKTGYEYTILDKGLVKISANSNMPIFPGETLNVIRFTLEFPKKRKIYLLDVNLRMVLLYSNGTDEMKSDLKKISEKLYPVNGSSEIEKEID